MLLSQKHKVQIKHCCSWAVDVCKLRYGSDFQMTADEESAYWCGWTGVCRKQRGSKLQNICMASLSCLEKLFVTEHSYPRANRYLAPTPACCGHAGSQRRFVHQGAPWAQGLAQPPRLRTSGLLQHLVVSLGRICEQVLLSLLFLLTGSKNFSGAERLLPTLWKLYLPNYYCLRWADQRSEQLGWTSKCWQCLYNLSHLTDIKIWLYTNERSLTCPINSRKQEERNQKAWCLAGLSARCISQ